MEQLKNESETELQNQSEAEMRDEKYMKEALKQAKKASLHVDTTAAIQIKVRLLMQKFPQ